MSQAAKKQNEKPKGAISQMKKPKKGYLFEDDILAAANELAKLSIQRSKLNEQIKEAKDDLIKAMNDHGHRSGHVKLEDGEEYKLDIIDQLKKKKTVRK